MPDNTKPLEDVTSAKGKPPIKGEIPNPDESTFKSYMAEEEQAGKVSSPFETKNYPFQVGNPTYESLVGQMDNAKDLMTTINQQLNTPNLKLKRSEQSLLNTKISDANEHIRTSAKKLGYNPPELQVPAKAPPITKFISYITDGQKQLEEAETQLTELSKTNQLKPEQMLLLQVKLSQAQQELEYSSMLLAKSIDFLKQTMNIPI